MKGKIAALLLVLACDGSVLAEANDESLRLEVRLTTGERSKDSSSETQTITVERNQLVWERTSTGHGPGQPASMRKEFRLSASEKEHLQKLIRAKLLVTEAIELPRSTPNFYFEVSIDSALDEKKGAIRMSGPRNASAIREEPLYEKSLALVKELFRILNTHDKGIRFEEFILGPIKPAQPVHEN